MGFDRRRRYTQQVIKEAYIDLLQKSRTEEITVKEICELADINRATFYRNFQDIYDLFETIEKELILEAFPQGTKSTDLTQMLKIIYDNQIFYREALRDGKISGNSLQIVERIKEELIPCISDEKRKNEEEYNICFRYIVFGTTGVIKDWIDSGCEKPINELAEVLNKIAWTLLK